MTRSARHGARGGRHAAPLRPLLSLLAPALCAICAEPCGPADPACARCVADLAASCGGSLTVPGIERVWAATAYEGTARRLVAQLKFAGRLPLAGVAAGLIGERMPAPPLGAALVAVPADPWRHRLRGFDPAELIATELADLTGLPPSRCLARSHARRQVGRSRAQRIAGGPIVRAAAPPPAVAVLVDDVVTTGATLAACAWALRAAGCGAVLALAFAQA